MRGSPTSSLLKNEEYSDSLPTETHPSNLSTNKHFANISRLIDSIKSHENPSKLESELDSQSPLTESLASCLLAFSLACNNPDSFDLLKRTHSILVDSIAVYLKIDPKLFEFNYLYDSIEEKSAIFDEVIHEFIKTNYKDIALDLIRTAKTINIYPDLLEFLAEYECVEIINELLSKKTTCLINSSEVTEELSNKSLQPEQAFQYVLSSGEDTIVHAFIKDHNLELDDGALGLIASFNRFKLLDMLDQYENPTPQTLLYALKYHAFGYLLTNYTYFLDYVSSGTVPRLLEGLIESCENFEDIEVKIHLLKNCIWYIKQQQAYHLFKKFEDAIVDKLDDRPNIFDYTHNPIKLAVLLIEFFRLLGDKYRIMHGYYMKIKCELVKYISGLTDAINNEESLRLLFLEEDFEGREVLVIIQELKLYNALEDKRMKILVKTLWDANYVLGGNFMSASHLYRLLVDWPLNSKVDVEKETRFQQRDIKNIPNNELNFNVWKKGIGLRYMTQSVIYFALAIFFQILIYQFLREGETFDENKKDVHIIAEKIYRDLRFFLMCSVIWFILPIKVLFDYAFRVRAKRNYPFFNNELFVLLVQVISTIFIFTEFLRMDDSCRASSKNFYVCFCQDFFKDKPFFLKEFLSIMMFCIWMRAIMSLTVTELIGPLVTATVLLMKDMMRFLLLFGLINIAFGCFFSLILVQLEDFRNPFKAMYTLYLAAILVFDPSILDHGDDRTRLYAYVFMLVYLFVSAVVLINLLIAVFTSTYTKAEEKAKALYLSQTISLRPVYKHNKRYSYYVSAAFPFTALLIPAIPFVLVDPESETVNRVMLHVEYFPFMLCSFCCFLILNIIFMPFTFLKVLIHKFLLMFKRNKFGFFRKLFDFIVYASFGIVFTVYQLLADCGMFIKHLYSNNIEKLFKDQREIEHFNPGTLKDLCEFLRSLREDVGDSEITIDELLAKYEDNLKIRKLKLEGHRRERDIDAMKQVLHTLEYEKNDEKKINLDAAYCLLKSIDKSWKYFELTKGGRKRQRKYAKQHSIINNINRRIVCQHEDIEDKESDESNKE